MVPRVLMARLTTPPLRPPITSTPEKLHAKVVTSSFFTRKPANAFDPTNPDPNESSQHWDFVESIHVYIPFFRLKKGG